MTTEERMCDLQWSPPHANSWGHSSPNNLEGFSGVQPDSFPSCPGLKPEGKAEPAEGNQPLSDFWLVMSELKLLHDRIANEHLREVSALRAASLECCSRGNNVLDEYTVPSERLAGDVSASEGIHIQIEQECCPDISVSSDKSKDEHEDSYIRFGSVVSVGEYEDYHDDKDEGEHENNSEDEFRFQPHVRNLTTRSACMKSVSMESMKVALSENFGMALRAQLRSTWKITGAVEAAVPRWSGSSDQPAILENPQHETPINFTDSRKTASLRRRSAKSVFHRQSSMPVAYGSNQGRWPWYIIHPQSALKVTIDLIGIAVMLFDFVMIPLSAFDLPKSTFFFWLELTMRIFWVVDMFVSFFTGRFIKGVLTSCWSKIAKDYMKGMFVLDLVLIVADWSTFIIENTTSASLHGIGPIRIMKGMRFAKVMRVFKLERILAEIQAQINSTYLLLVLRPIILIFCLLFFNHLLACLWYAVGESSTHGWTAQLQDSSKAFLYFSSLHWAISQLHGSVEIFPENVQERIFQCLSTLIALLLFSTFLSSITNAMAQIHSLRQERFALESQIRDVLANRHISAQLTARIKKRLAFSGKTNTALDSKIISRLPKDLAIDLLYESRDYMVERHDYFFLLGYRCPRVLRHLCHEAMEEEMREPKQGIFSSGDICLNMYFVVKGELKYQQADLTVFGTVSSIGRKTSNKSLLNDFGVTLTQKCSICEPVLWLTWSHHGTLVTTDPTHLLTVNAHKFGEVVKQFHFAHVNSSRYARSLLEKMIQVGHYSDMSPP